MPDATMYMVNVLGGSVGGIFQAVVGHPLETVKVRVQAQDVRKPQFRGALDCFVKTLRLEGVHGLYKGVQVPLLTATLTNAALFGTNSITRTLVHGDKTRPIGVLETMFAAIIAAPVYALVVCPIDVVKSRLQIQATQAQTVYRGMFHGIWTIIKKEGAMTFVRGYIPTLSTRILGHPFYFGMNHFVKVIWAPMPTEAGEKLRVAVAGGIGGIAFWVACYPVDFVKTRMQTSRNLKNMNVVTMFKTVYAENGIRGFYRGFGPCIIRAFPANAVAFLGHDTVLKTYDAYKARNRA